MISKFFPHDFWKSLTAKTARSRCHWQYCISLNQEQREAYKPSLHWGWVQLENASSPVISARQGQSHCSEHIANFSNWAHIWWRPRKIYHLHMSVIEKYGWNVNVKVKGFLWENIISDLGISCFKTLSE